MSNWRERSNQVKVERVLMIEIIKKFKNSYGNVKNDEERAGLAFLKLPFKLLIYSIIYLFVSFFIDFKDSLVLFSNGSIFLKISNKSITATVIGPMTI